MFKKLKESHQKNNESEEEALDDVKAKVADGSYFKDALDWYFFRYVTAICDRTILIFGGILAGVVCFFLIGMIKGAFPLVVKDPIFIRAKNQGLYFPNLVHLKPKPEEAGYDENIKTVDEAVLKYLLINYIKNRENYDFSSASVRDVNIKFNRVKGISSEMEYRKFQRFMSKDNPDSPIYDFGLKVNRSIEIKSVKFISKERSNFASRALHYITGKIPTEAEVRFLVTKTTVLESEKLKSETQDYLVKLGFNFDGVSKVQKHQRSKVKFIVNNYQLFKVK